MCALERGILLSNKLVRDNIPDIITKSGKTPNTRILDNNEYFDELMKKLYEEIDEFKENHSPEELADIMEVLYAIARHTNNPTHLIEEIRAKKHKSNGGFEKRIFLESITDIDD